MVSTFPSRIDGGHHAMWHRKMQRVVLRALLGFGSLLGSTRKSLVFFVEESLHILHHPADRKALTSPDLIPRPWSPFCCSQYHRSTAPWTRSRCWSLLAPPQVLHVLSIRPPGWFQPSRLDCGTDLRNLTFRQRPSPERLYISSSAETHRHVLRSPTSLVLK